MRRDIFPFLLGAVLFVSINSTCFAEIASTTYVDNVAATKVDTEGLADKIAEAVTGKEDSSNKITSLDAADAENIKYPSAMAVKNALNTKVDTTVGTNQTLEGTYVVSGSLFVPTPSLPTM